MNKDRSTRQEPGHSQSYCFYCFPLNCPPLVVVLEELLEDFFVEDVPLPELLRVDVEPPVCEALHDEPLLVEEDEWPLFPERHEVVAPLVEFLP